MTTWSKLPLTGSKRLAITSCERSKQYEILILSTQIVVLIFFGLLRYYKLASSINNPTQQQSWALRPTEHLFIATIRHAPISRIYARAIINIIKELMDACGFNSTVIAVKSHPGDCYTGKIIFPRLLRDPRNQNCDVPRTLHVEDTIDTALARKLARLIKGGNENGNPSIDSGNCRRPDQNPCNFQRLLSTFQLIHGSGSSYKKMEFWWRDCDDFWWSGRGI